MPVSPVPSFLSSLASFSRHSVGCAFLDKVSRVSFRALGIGAVGMGIGAAVIYYVSSHFLPKNKPLEPLINPEDIEAVKSYLARKRAQPTPNYSLLGRAAIDFALNLPNIEPVPIYHNYMTQNENISKLITVHDTLLEDWDELYDKNLQGKEIWKDPEFVTLTDKLMRVAFALSSMTLDDLPAFTEALEKEGRPMTWACALTRTSSYASNTFFSLPRCYHTARAGLGTPNNQHQTTPNTNELDNAPFYTEGTLQSSWRALYNEYCNRRSALVEDRELEVEYNKGGDRRFVNWTQPDLDKTFGTCPDTLPGV